MKKILFVIGLTLCQQSWAQGVLSPEFTSIEQIADHRVILYDTQGMKSMKHIPIYMMNEKGKLKVVKDTLELSGLKDGMRFDEPAAIEQVKKDTYVKLVKDGIAYYFLVDEKDNPYIPSALRNYDYWTEMLALFREKYEYKEMVFKNSSMYNEGEQAGKYAEVTWTKINIPSSKEGQVTFSYEVEGNTDSLDPLSVDENVFLTEAAVNTAKQVYENGQKKLEEYKIQYEYVDVNKSKDFRYKGADVLVGQYLPLTWTAVFLPQGLHDAVRYRVSGGLSVNDYSESEISGMSGILMSTDDVIRKEIGEEWVDVAYKETDDESDNAQTAESVKAIHVDGFELDESDLTAMQQGTSVQDKDGNRCALIKIETKESDLTFDVGTQGIVKTEHKTGEEWLYVPSGIRAIQISHPQYGSYQYVIPRKVEKGRSYNMQLSFDKKTEVRRKGEITQGLKDAANRYDRVYGFHKGFAPVVLNESYGLINEQGNEIIPCKFSYLNFYDEELRYEKLDSSVFNSDSIYIFVVNHNNQMGIINLSGDIIIPLEFDRADMNYPSHFCFSEGVAPVQKNEKMGCIDGTGKIIIPIKYGFIDNFHEGLAAFYYPNHPESGGNTRIGYIDKKGNEKIVFQGNGYCSDFNGGRAEVSIGGKEITIDKKGNKISAANDELSFGENFNGYYVCNNKTIEKYGIVDVDGVQKTPFIYDQISISEDKTNALICKDEKYGYINSNCDIIVPVENDYYDEEKKVNNGVILDPRPNYQKNFGKCGFFTSVNRKHGITDLNGKVIIPPIFEDVDTCGEGLYKVKSSDKYGCINNSGKIVIPIVYDDIKFSSEGLIGAGKKSGKIINGKDEIEYGYINRIGKTIIPFRYKDVSGFYNGLAKVCNIINGRYLYGFINSEGDLVTEIKYSTLAEDGIVDFADWHVKPESPNSFWVVQKGDGHDMDYGYMDKYGNDTFDD